MNRLVSYVTVWIFSVVLLAAQTTGLTPAEEREGFKPLFDGKTLNGWTAHVLPPERVNPARGNRPGTGKWVVESGVIASVPETGTGKLVSNESFSDFVLRLEFMITPGANSGVFFRAPETGDITEENSFEVNMSDVHEEWPTGSLNAVQRTSQAAPRTDGKWNTYEITVRGNHVIVVLNGEKTADARANRLPRGRIAFQYTRYPPTGKVMLRNIRIKTL